MALADPTEENIRKASVRTTHRSVLKKLVNLKLQDSGEWANSELPDFISEDDVNAFEKLSEDQEPAKDDEMNLSSEEEDILTEKNEELDFQVDDSPIFTDEEQKEEQVESEDMPYGDVKYEHPEYQNNLENQENAPSVEKENDIEEIDISDFDDYKDPNEDIRNELMETLASFEKNKPNIAEEYQFENLKEEEPQPENNIADTQEEVPAELATKTEENTLDEVELEQEVNAIEEELIQNHHIEEENSREDEEPIEEPNPKKAEQEDPLTIDDSYFDLNNFLDEEIEKPDKKKELVKKTRNFDLSQKQGVLIDSFVKNMPSMPSPDIQEAAENKVDLSTNSVTEDKGLISEQLALIFHKQQKTKKAIEIYEQLKLKYPNKKTYFALQIEKLKKDI
eukprot:TRINITY_DN59389_c0_g1_i1.p1 TRINITY_DN59389_c0_g1~~TRINITY_DN59389_c0_g1_i1.p1  ORF type:complete len:394 (+),score=11.11 TRINITY_DN59389_c0_g1_i1:201-1382(+)